MDNSRLCDGDKILLSLFPRKTERHPIFAKDFRSRLCNTREGGQTRKFIQWMGELGISTATSFRNSRTVCAPFLVGDCVLPSCPHGHPPVNCRPSSHSMAKKPLGVLAPLPRSQIIEGSYYQCHSLGATLACRGYDLLTRLDSSRPTNRDPIKTKLFLTFFEEPRFNHPKKEDLLLFQKWMHEIGVTESSVQLDYLTVCPSFLVGDCLPFRSRKWCKHGHPAMKKHPLLHPLVMEGGERIRLKEGHVKVAPILGYDESFIDADGVIRGLDGLILGPDRDEGPKYCVRGAACQFRFRCIYTHHDEDQRSW
eukprot:CAMPEP_0201493392 /NCGR_PEP_ID=MMETSP0151_2-20130828/38116_1 /ASSEMBLY_ACC=CAM_ASM_000257 /TAXON_ID=200890 /ORGANISM="Paramoeba atlantica, Strain 621/1 / CCAP 1560/9" /LENGTH=308 /DNA_ID=CAMNT_0047880779 /DNA_START=11 /DNA_END=934 /DNA_ORIENTATION=-